MNLTGDLDMKNFSIVTCRREREETESQRPGIKALFNRIVGFFKTEKFEPRLDIITDGNGLKDVLVNLPYALSELDSLSNSKVIKIKKFIEELKTEHSLESVIIPAALSHISWLKEISDPGFDGSRLYKALIFIILNEIFTGRGYKIGELEIAILHTEDGGLLFETINFLADHAKYLTVVTDRAESIEGEIERVYSETGLSVGLTKDYRSGMRNADIIINLGNLRAKGVNFRVNPNAVILNFGQLEMEKLTGENPVINGVDVRLPPEASAVKQQVGDFFNNLQLAEILLSHGMETAYGEGAESGGENSVKRFSDAFVQGGYSISSFYGRRGVVKTRDIRINLNKDREPGD